MHLPFTQALSLCLQNDQKDILRDSELYSPSIVLCEQFYGPPPHPLLPSNWSLEVAHPRVGLLG